MSILKNDTRLTTTYVTVSKYRPYHRRLYRPWRDAGRPRQLRHYDDRLIPCTGIDYVSISFCIGVGAWCTVLPNLSGNPGFEKIPFLCHHGGHRLYRHRIGGDALLYQHTDLLFFFGLLLPFGTTAFALASSWAITPILGEKRAGRSVSGARSEASRPVIGDALMSPALNLAISRFDIAVAMQALTVPFLLMIPIVIWMHSLRKGLSGNEKEGSEEAVSKNVSLIPMLRFALKDRDYRLIVIGFGTCGFNMSIIESHLFSQYLSYGIDGSTASLTLTVYGIATMIGAAGTGFLGAVFKMKNVLGCVYAIRVVISLAFLFLPKSVAFAFAATALLGLSGDATVPPTSGIISKKIWLPKHGRLIWLYLDRPSGRRLFQCLSRRIFCRYRRRLRASLAGQPLLGGHRFDGQFPNSK